MKKEKKTRCPSCGSHKVGAVEWGKEWEGWAVCGECSAIIKTQDAEENKKVANY